MTKIIYIISILIAVLYLVFLTAKYPKIPEIIPIHRLGNEISYGTKKYLYIPVMINLLFLLVVGIMINSPKKWIKIDPTEITYETISLIIACISLIFTIVMSLILFGNIVYK